MTVEEVHNHNRDWAVKEISYEAVVKTEAIVAFRAWITKYLNMAYDAGFKAAKEGKI
jgi:hypothetical protein